MNFNLLVEVSPGELLDKLTILQLKSEKIDVVEKLNNVLNERNILQETWVKSPFASFNVESQIKELYDINSVIWNLEDLLRDKERTKQFDDEFITAARSVYVSNDKRAKIKREINEILGSNIIEEKSYTDYNK